MLERVEGPGGRRQVIWDLTWSLIVSRMMMDHSDPSPFRPSLSIRQMMKLVVFGAIASACVAPGYHLVEIGVSTWPGFLILEGVSVPLVLAVAAFPLVREGPLKDWLIRSSLLVSLTVALGFAIYLLIFILAGWASGRMPLEFAMLAFVGPLIAVLGLFLTELARRLLPRRCPDCSRLSTILDTKATLLPGDGQGKSYRCLCCQKSFRRP